MPNYLITYKTVGTCCFAVDYLPARGTKRF